MGSAEEEPREEVCREEAQTKNTFLHLEVARFQLCAAFKCIEVTAAVAQGVLQSA